MKNLALKVATCPGPLPDAMAKGLALVELLASLAMLGILLAGLNGILGQTTAVWNNNSITLGTYKEAAFAMERMRQSVLATQNLLIPAIDNPNSSQDESLRDVLAMTMDPRWDRDNDGFADADNDKDGRIDEDLGNDNTNDGKSGIIGIDDDGDGSIDEADFKDNDEQGSWAEDWLNGIDDDGDLRVDEDIYRDMNDDGQPGIAGVDDDGDGTIDEGNNFDDDEDGTIDEDWMDVVVYFLSGTQLMERLPNINPIDGTDYTERPIADGVTGFTAQMIYGERATLVSLNLTLTASEGETFNLNQTVRVGSRK